MEISVLKKGFQDFSEIYKWSRSGRLNENFSVFVGISKGILLLDRISKRGFQCFGWNVRISVNVNPYLEKNKAGFQLFFVGIVSTFKWRKWRFYS